MRLSILLDGQVEVLLGQYIETAEAATGHDRLLAQQAAAGAAGSEARVSSAAEQARVAADEARGSAAEAKEGATSASSSERAAATSAQQAQASANTIAGSVGAATQAALMADKSAKAAADCAAAADGAKVGATQVVEAAKAKCEAIEKALPSKADKESVAASIAALARKVGAVPDATNLQAEVDSKADKSALEQSSAALNQRVSAEVEKLLAKDAAAKQYLLTDEAKKTYLAIVDTYDMRTGDDFGVSIQAGTANTLYTPNITKPRGVYLVQPYRYELKCVLTGSAYFMTAFGEFVTGEGSSGSINLTPDAARGPAYEQIPFVVRVTSANATFRFGLGVRGYGNGEGTVTVTAGAGGMLFSATRIG